MTALSRVFAGRIDLPAQTWEEADRFVSRTVSMGRIIARAHDGYRSSANRVHLAIVEHPICDPGEVIALFWMGGANPSTGYLCSEADAREALRDPGAFNL